MEISGNIIYLIYSISAANSILIGVAIAVFFQNRRSPVNKSFSGFLIIMAFWMNFSYIYSILLYMPHIFLPLAIIAGSFLAPSFYIFARYLSDEFYKIKKIEYIGLIPCIVLIVYNIFHLSGPHYKEIINDIINSADGILFRKLDWINLLYAAYIFTGIILGLFFIFKRIKIEKVPARKKQLIFINVTIIAGFLLSKIVINSGSIHHQQISTLTIAFIILITFVIISFSLLRHRAWTVEYMMDLLEEQEEKLAESYDELKSLDKSKSDFFTNLSHEMKTPLTLISNYMDKYLENHKSEEEILIIKNNIDKLLEDMINFFDLQKVDRGLALYEHNQIIDLSSTLKQKLDLYRSMVSKMEISISQEIEKSIYIKADLSALERMINNLMNNATRYNKRKGFINVVLSGSESDVKLSIKDNGIGIEQQEIDHIFEPYYQVTHKKKNIQGVGMGLSIVKEIIDSLNGKISVNSIPGEGTEFIITLGRYFMKEGDEISQDNLTLKTVNHLPFYSENIHKSKISGNVNLLIVEDNIDLLHLMLNKLAEKYNVFGASNGRTALKKLENIPVPDVIVSDIMMDEMDGTELCKTISNDSRFSDIPFIFLTARSMIENKIEGLNLGAIDYIYKPFVLDELISKIDAVIRYRELKNTLFEKDKFTSLGMLLGGISHEIFNPLSGITAPLENLEKYISESGIDELSSMNKYISQIRISAEKIQYTVNKIKLLYSDKPLITEDLCVTDAVNSAAEGFIKDYKDIKYIIKIDKGIRIKANPSAVLIIFSNLISNASEAMNGKGTVILSAAQEDNEVLIKIEDSGPGILPEDIKVIFNAFYTTKNMGMGLGLNIVKNLCIKQGWDIIAESKKVGAVFTITAEIV